MGALALFLAITGGTAYAANTIFTADIVDNEVFSADVRDDALAGGGLTAADLQNSSVGTAEVVNGAIRSADVRDDTIVGGGLAAADLQSNSVGAAELAETAAFANGAAAINDEVGLGSTKVELVNTGGYTIVGDCVDAGGGVVTAQVTAKRANVADPITISADSDAPGGLTDDVDNSPGTEVVLATHGPTINPHWGAGDYAMAAHKTNTGAAAASLSGVVGVGTHVNGADCKFSATGIG